MTNNRIEPNILTQVQSLAKSIIDEVGKAYIGPRSVSRVLLTAVIAKGHVLIEGVPGVAKTTLVKAFAEALGCENKRIQFTPDLLPSDITGTNILDMATSQFKLQRGPLFANVVLGDEINRAPAKTQSALLEAMQESQITIDGETYELPSPFFVLATQNPLEHEGTYPLPDAQIDRFLFKLEMGYPSVADEKRMLLAYGQAKPKINSIVSAQEIERLHVLASEVFVAEEILDYVLAISQFTRSHQHVLVGASPRASLAILHAVKSLALLSGRDYVIPDDVQELAAFALAHRIVMTADAELQRVGGKQVIQEALSKVPYRAVQAR